jgi:hypothetical protein
MARTFDLGRARSTLTRSGRVSCFVLHQQAARLEKELEMHHGFHRTPLVPGCFKVSQQVFPSAAGAVQRHLSKERHSLGCASQHDWRTHADTQRRIDWKVRHGHVTSHCGPKFHTPYRTLSFDQLGGRRAVSFVWSGHIRPVGILSPIPARQSCDCSQGRCQTSVVKRIGSSQKRLMRLLGEVKRHEGL